jgi:hypothetical protein
LPSDRLSRRKKAFFTAILLFGLPLLTVLLVEGAVSLVLVAADISWNPRLPPERRYTKYDPELGWVSIPNMHLRDMYGPGVWLKTNAQGHRAAASFAPGVPAGRVRVVCSGDSFTFGHGVSNDGAWCERLGEKNRLVEPVNMGQAGYGVDQSFLWYRRDGSRLDHDIHIFAFIWDDFTRMNAPLFNGYAKPVLAMRNGELVVQNVPVPRRSYRMPQLTTWLLRSRQTLSDLRIAELARRVRASLTDEEERKAEGVKRTWQVAEKIFDELAELHRKRGSVFVLLHLPADNDAKYEPARYWEAELRAYAARTGVPYVDLGDDLQRLPPDSLAQIFGAHRHYTQLGNDWVATRLLEHLAEIPATARLLRRGEG